MLRRISIGVLSCGLLLAAGGCDDDDPLVPEVELFTAVLTGDAERPDPVVTDGMGEAVFQPNGQGVEFLIGALDLTDVVAAHIHGPAPEEDTAGILVTLFADPDGVDVDGVVFASGTFPSTSFPIDAGISVDSVLVLMDNGMAYVNVHTTANPTGEIRGQITRTN